MYLLSTLKHKPFAVVSNTTTIEQRIEQAIKDQFDYHGVILGKVDLPTSTTPLILLDYHSITQEEEYFKSSIILTKISKY